MAPPAAMGGKGVIDDLMPTEEDLLYEEELLRNPYALKMWFRYLQARMGAPEKRRYLIYERALKALPGSYKVSRRRGHSPHTSPVARIRARSRSSLTIAKALSVLSELWQSLLQQRACSKVASIQVTHSRAPTPAEASADRVLDA